MSILVHLFLSQVTALYQSLVNATANKQKRIWNNFSKNIPLKHMVSEMSGRGNALVLKCPVSAGEVFGRGIVRSGKCKSGKSPSGKCHSGICPWGSVCRETVQSGSCPLTKILWPTLSENFRFALFTSNDDSNFWKKTLIWFNKVSSAKNLPTSNGESFLESIFNLN